MKRISTAKKTKTHSSVESPCSWLREYAPTSVADVALHHTKVSAVRKWITESVSRRAAAWQTLNSGEIPHPTRPDILGLAGCSGGGKSTLVTILCAELNVECVEWSDDFQEGGDNYKPSGSDYLQSRGSSALSDFSEFVQQSSFPTLQLAVRSKRTELALPGDITSPQRLYSGKVILMHSPPYQNSTSISKKSDYLLKFSEMLLSFSDPVIVILSEISGSDDMIFAADKALCLSSEQKQRINFQMVYCNPITPPRIVKALKRILTMVSDDRKHRLALSSKIPRLSSHVSGGVTRPLDESIGGALLTMHQPTDNELISISLLCLGDIRFVGGPVCI